jgi:DNA polymerase kappa
LQSEKDFAYLQTQTHLNALSKRLSNDRTSLHAALGMFICVVVQLYDPSLVNVFFVVGSAGNHGIVSTYNYLARQFGIRSEMATFIAKNLCSNLVIVEYNGERYHEVSKKVMQIFK